MRVFITVDAHVHIDRYEHVERSIRDDFLLLSPDFLLAFTLFFHRFYLIVPLPLPNCSLAFIQLFQHLYFAFLLFSSYNIAFIKRIIVTYQKKIISSIASKLQYFL